METIKKIPTFIKRISMKKFKTNIIVTFLFIEIFFILGITLIVKTLDYENYTTNKFIQTTKLLLLKTAKQDKINEIIDNGGKDFNKLLTSLDTAKNSFSFAINSNKKVKMYNKTSAETSEALDISLFPRIQEVEQLSKLVSKHETGSFEYVSKISKEELLCFVQAIPNSNWSLVVTVLKSSIIMKTLKEKRYIFSGIALCIISLTLLVAMVGWICPKETKNKFWYSTSLYAIVLTIGISALCVFSNKYNDFQYNDKVSLTDQNIIDGFLDKYDNQLIENGEKQINRVNVGIFIKNIDFKNSDKVNFTGYIWEKLSKEQIGKIKEGLYFSDAFDSKFNKLYEKIFPNGSKVFVWYFTCSTNCDMKENYLYPFDVETLLLRLNSEDFGNNVILVPETKDYVDIEPYSRPGIYNDLSLPGWNITQSFFTYLQEKYDTTFGVFNSHTGSFVNTELYYNIVLRRSFLGAFISIFLPIFVTLVMVFILLMTCSNDEKRQKKLGFSAGAILASTAALFYVVIVAQIDLRDKVSADGLIYMDIYYFVTYLQFMVVSINSILLCWPDKFKWIAWEDNIIVKSAFWPFVTTIIFISTLYYYFPV